MAAPPLVVVHGAEPDVDALVDEAVEDLVAAGWTVVPGWADDGAGPALGPSAGVVVRTGVVQDAGELRGVVLAALRGDGVVVAVRADRLVTEQLCDELRRLGDLQVRSAAHGWPALSGDDRRLLDLLAAGRPLGRAAEELHVSRRSADRRLAAARERLAVRTTGEAVAARRRRRAASTGSH
jgi:hypothetical protein